MQSVPLVRPLVSIVMPTHNDGPYLREAIESVVAQSRRDWELIIVDDGSTDDTHEILDQYSDARIRRIRHEVNQGNAAARNTGMEAARGKYIAHMDSDDRMTPDRLALQVEYLEHRPEIDLVAGFLYFYDGTSWFLKHYPLQNEYIHAQLFFVNVFGQPTVMLRTAFQRTNHLWYRPELENMEDYDMWYRIGRAGARMACLPVVVHYYRLNPSQLSAPNNLDGRNRMLRDFFRERLQLLNITLEGDDFQLLHNFFRQGTQPGQEQYKKLVSLLALLEKQNTVTKAFPLAGFRSVLFFYRLKLIRERYFAGGNAVKAGIRLSRLLLGTRPDYILRWWNNEGKFLSKGGPRHAKPGFPPGLGT